MLEDCASLMSQDEIEIAIIDALADALKKAEIKKRKIEYNQQIAKEIEVPVWDKHDYRIWFEQRYQTENNKEFEFTKDHDFIVNSLCMYFAGDKDFEKIGEGFSLEKGIMLRGGVGVGKTSIMKAFRLNPHKSFGVIKCQQIVNTFLNHSEQVYLRYTVVNRNIASAQNFGQEYFGWCYDDLGEEDQANKYGNKHNVMAGVLDKIYNDYEMKGVTHLTTNLTGKQIKDLYGERILSRIVAIFNVLQFPATAKDMRK